MNVNGENVFSHQVFGECHFLKSQENECNFLSNLMKSEKGVDVQKFVLRTPLIRMSPPVS